MNGQTETDREMVYVEDIPRRILGNLIEEGTDGQCWYIYAGIGNRCPKDAVAYAFMDHGNDRVRVEMCADHAREEVPEPPTTEQKRLVTDGGAAIQQTLTGGEADHVECEYYDVCTSNALYIGEILHYGEGMVPVKMCPSCADEHTEIEGNDVERLKPSERYHGEAGAEVTVYAVITNYPDDPHPHLELVTTDKDEAEEMLEQCRRRYEPPHPVAWQLEEREVSVR